MKTLKTIAASLLLLTVAAVGQTTRTWEQSSFGDFEKGSSHGVAVRSDGVLELAPSFRAVETTPSTYIWAVASDEEGNLLAATGAPARVYRVTPQGQLSTLLQPSELEVQAITVAPDGTIYAATSPDGKIYRIERNVATATTGRKRVKTQPKSLQPEAPVNSQINSQPSSQPTAAALDPDYRASVFFEPHTKYIWALTLDAQGRLYIATGDRGEIYRVEANGSGSIFFKSDEAHIRSLAFDKTGNLIAGSDGSGLVYRISAGGEAFVLYSAPKKEITALAVDRQGNIFAAAAGEKRANSNTPSPAAEAAQSGAGTPAANFAQLPLPLIGAPGSEVYRIAPDGSPRRIWQSREDLVYALAFDPTGHLLAGTGNKGKIYVLSTGESRFTDLLQASASQVIGFAPAPHGGLWVATSNLGKLFLLGEAAEHEGTFDSDVFDAKIFSRWGHIEFRGAGNVELFARSGNVDNPDRNWSPWQKIDLAHDAALQAPSARYVQWRVVLHSGRPWPQVESVALNYLPKNVAPEVDEIAVLVGQKFPQASRLIADVISSGQASVSNTNTNPPQPQPDRNSIAVRWSAHDDNGDQLSYSVFYRGQGESRWQLLKSGLADRFYSFESDLLPDGRYTIRVVASDAPSHSPDEFLTGARASSAFDVDNTPPVIGGLTARSDESGLHVTFRASDNYSIIRRAEFSVDAGEWQFVAPVGGISDARTENYDLTVAVPRDVHPDTASDSSTGGKNASTAGQEAVEAASPSAAPAGEAAERANRAGEEHVVVIRVFDRADNVGTAKVVVHGGKR